MSQGEKYPITLERLMFVRTSVLAVPGHQPPVDPSELKPENALNVVPEEGSPNRFNASMRTTLNLTMDIKFPYAIDVECIAVLSSDGSLSSDEALRGVTINAHSAMYGAIREAVAWLTARQPYGPLMLGFSVLQFQKPEAPEAADPPSDA